jgi:hypothetical protein
MYILRAGAVRVSCAGRGLGVLGAGSFFGEVWRPGPAGLAYAPPLSICSHGL